MAMNPTQNERKNACVRDRQGVYAWTSFIRKSHVNKIIGGSKDSCDIYLVFYSNIRYCVDLFLSE